MSSNGPNELYAAARARQKKATAWLKLHAQRYTVQEAVPRLEAHLGSHLTRGTLRKWEEESGFFCRRSREMSACGEFNQTASVWLATAWGAAFVAEED